MIDGVIKYNFDFNKSTPLNNSYFYEIEKIREELFNLGLIGISNGIGFGNISQRVDKNSFVITGTQTGHLENLNANHYSFVEEYDDKKFYLKSSGATEPSSEALTHGTIYNLSQDINTVIHIHSQSIWDFMLKDNYLKTSMVEYGSIDMINEINKIFANIDPLSNPKFVMSGHQDGVMFFGKTLMEAKLNLLRVFRLTFKLS